MGMATSPPSLGRTHHLSAGEAELGLRIAWLLRTSRTAASMSANDFARETLAGPQRLGVSDLTTIEGGRSRASANAIRTYEHVLGMPRRSLLGPCEAMSRVLVNTALERPRVLPAPEVRRELDRVATELRHGRPTGADWLSFADLLTQPDAVVLPGFLEDDWLQQLLAELARSTGASYLSRSEALARIMGEEIHAQRLVTLVREELYKVGVHAGLEALAVWAAGRDRASVDAAIPLLSSDEFHIRRGAGVALLRRLWRGDLTQEHQSRIAASLHRLVTYLGGDIPDELIALGQHIDPRLGESIRLVSGRSAPAPASPGDVDRWCNILGGPAVSQDPVLQSLLREGLSDEHPERRSRANLMLDASPFGPALARAAVGVPHTHESDFARKAMKMVCNLAHHVEASDLLPHLNSPDPLVRDRALIALAHGPGIGPDLPLREYLLDQRTTRATIYAAGMTEHPALAEAISLPSLPVALRTTASLWAAQGGRVTDPQEAA